MPWNSSHHSWVQWKTLSHQRVLMNSSSRCDQVMSSPPLELIIEHSSGLSRRPYNLLTRNSIGFSVKEPPWINSSTSDHRKITFRRGFWIACRNEFKVSLERRSLHWALGDISKNLRSLVDDILGKRNDSHARQSLSLVNLSPLRECWARLLQVAQMLQARLQNTDIAIREGWCMKFLVIIGCRFLKSAASCGIVRTQESTKR